MSELFYLQDSRQFVGNDLLWWADGGIYTTDVSKAEAMTKEEAFKQNRSRSTDIPWPKDYVDKKTRPVVDCQLVDYEVALASVGIYGFIKGSDLEPNSNHIEICRNCISKIESKDGICKRCIKSD